MCDESVIRQKFLELRSCLDERARRCWAATEAKAIGWGGVSHVANATGMSRDTIAKGIKELNTLPSHVGVRVRKEGGGRKKNVEKDSTLLSDIETLVEPATRGDPESPLKYTSKSVRILAQELREHGHTASHELVAQLLRQNGYSLQANKKTQEGTSHPDRNAQFEFINKDVKMQQKYHQPVISVDTKKKEIIGNIKNSRLKPTVFDTRNLVGNDNVSLSSKEDRLRCFKNNGREWRPKGRPKEVRVHDFEIPELGKVVPYGIFDIDKNRGWVNVGIDGDTAEFAVESIRRWWNADGKKTYPHATSLTITADAGGSNSPRARLWKYELQRFSNETRVATRVRHFPPGTSKWNKIEHRLFSFISQNWRGKPLISRAVIVNLIAATKTSKGLTVKCFLDTNKYPTGKKVTDDEYANINITPEKFHSEWNYNIKPNKKN